VAREGSSLLKALGEQALLSADFPLGSYLRVFDDNKAAITLCKDG
jgi:hypothetical protein